MKRVAKLLLPFALMFFANMSAFASVAIKSVEAHQRYPWNGLVDISVAFDGSAEDVESAICIFAATNCENGTTIPVASIARNGADTGSDTTRMRRFVWNATNDIGAVKIDDFALSVGVKVLGGVQLWKDGPYWAECNVGASQPEDYGYYFWWGDTSGCKRNSNDNGWISTWNYVGFLFCPENCPTHNKNTWQLEEDGYIASTYNLMSVYDAATVRLGAPWRMPTYAEYTALISNCNASWTVRNGVNGMLISGKDNYASKNIFLPATGDGGGSKRYFEGSAAFYWSSTPINDTWPIYCTNTWSLCCEGGRLGVIKGPRYAGQPVRPIRGFSDGEGPGVVVNGVTTHLKLDCRTGVRECSAEGEELRYDVAWYENGTEARIAEDGAVVMTGTAGEYTYHPIPSCSTRHVTFNLEVRSGEQIVGDETAEFTCPATLAHIGIVTKEAVEPTSITPGSTAEIRCSQCNELMQASEAIPALGLYVRHVTAKQRYPWNGLVDVVVTLEGASNDVAQSECIFSLTNSATGAAVPVVSITQNGSDIGSSTTWTRRYVWDAMADVGSVKIDDLSLTACAKVSSGVQLWQDGPYWAECNIGARQPEEHGCYFWCGDTVGYKRNPSNTGWISTKNGLEYVFGEGDETLSRLKSSGLINPSGNLAENFDAATVQLGVPWRMPTDSEFSALISKCDTTWVERNGVYGRLVSGRGSYASKSIFLPATGRAGGSNLYRGDMGYYWSSSGNSFYAWYLFFHPCDFDRNYDYRVGGMAIRPLRESDSPIRPGLTTHLKLDCRTGVRECSTDGEQLYYDASWYENGAEARIIENEAIITSGTAGIYNWHPNLFPCCSTHTLKLEVRAGEQVVGTETAVFKSAATQEHSEVVTAVARAATCTEAGCTKGSYCSRCNSILSVSTVLPALGHVEVVTTVARSATCNEAGCMKGSYCSRCNAVLSTSTVLPALGHSEVVTKESVEPTSAAPGSTAEIRCSRCNEMLQTSEVIPALGYIRDVAARQLWPHNKVALSFGVADDIGEITDTNGDLSVWCARGIKTNVATQIIGDRSARSGPHRVIWDMEAEGLKLANGETVFGVAEKPLGGVQLWKDGPYWAECNVGATKPEECGYYFWWGDTVGYKRNADNNGWVSVKDGSSFHFYSGNCPTYGKNNSQLKSAGYIDSTGNLVAAHDAATAHLGAPWRMSTDAEFAALISNCTTTWTHRNGVYGHLVTGKGDYSSKSIFLPAAGSGLDAYLHYTEFGSSWSSTPSSSFSSSAILLYFGSGDFTRYDGGRFNGSPVRPLRTSSK